MNAPRLATSPLTAALLLLCGLSLLAGCNEDTDTGLVDPGEGLDFEARPMLQNVAVDVIFATYADLSARAGALKAATQQLQQSPTADNLEAAREAWRAARAPWEQSESFLYGPVDTQQLDPALDSWPVNVPDLDGVLASGDALTQGYVANLGFTLRGFHTTEFLLFGDDSSRVADAFTERELQYLTAVTAVLEENAQTLAQGWDPEAAGSYADVLSTAGEAGNTTYANTASAVQEIVTGLANIAGEVGTTKIGVPFSDREATEVESRFSGNSLTDFQNNIRSIRHIYTGDYGEDSGPGLTNLVAEVNPDLDARIQDEIAAAIEAIGAIRPPFRAAITEHRPAVGNARDAVLTLEATLVNDLAQLVNQADL